MKDLKFCSSCQMHRKIEGGFMKSGKHRTRWVCVECAKAAELRRPQLMASFAPKKPESDWKWRMA